MTEKTPRESKRIRRVLDFVGYNYFDTRQGQKADLSFIDRNPFNYKGEKCFSFVMTSSWLNQLLDYSKCNLELGCRYDVLTKYNFDFKADYVVAIYPHQESTELPYFVKENQ